MYDPIGFISPVVFHAKLILQESWERKLAWDEPLPSDIASKWITWCNDLERVKCITIPRCYAMGKGVNYELFGYCDASTKGYAAVVYLRTQLASGIIGTSLVASKTRIAPVNHAYTIPKLELLGCFILCSLMGTVNNAIKDQLNITKVTYWTDSTINLFRIRGVKNEYKQFVQNRVNHIRKLSHINEWFYIPTKLNPADLASRGCLPDDILRKEEWLSGPKFMTVPNFNYRTFEEKVEVTKEVYQNDLELKSKCRDGNNLSQISMVTDNVICAVNKQFETWKGNLAAIIDINKYNCINKLLRITAYVLKFARRDRKSGALDVEDIAKARKMWVITEQKLQKKLRPLAFLKSKASLGLYFEDHVMRCRGRILNSDLPYDTKCPIYIPKNSKLAELIVVDAHAKVFHNKEKSTLVEIRANYWIPQCRKLVRNVLKNCYVCKRLEGRKFALPPPPPLPSYRVDISPPFTNVGLDHMGPLWVHDIYAKGKSHKVYVALFTCCTTRMIHLELQPNLEATACIRVMKRTFARVGTPRLMISDNHKTFKSAQVKRFSIEQGIAWKYILELSPHWGGFYERLNGLVKRSLRKILWRAKLSYEEVETILIEIEGILNSRPLGYVYDDNFEEPLTPSHLMFGRRLQNRAFITTDVQGECDLFKRYNHVITLTEHFWKRFSGEYLTELRERAKHGKDNTSAIKVGDVVIINQRNMPRNSWPLGKVVRLVKSSDELVRGAVLTSRGGQLSRPLNLLYPLEISSEISADQRAMEDKEETH